MQHYKGINIGSGQHYADGWWNVDVIPTDKGRQPDQLIDIFTLPVYYSEPTFAAAYIGHVLEHINYSDVPKALRCIAEILLPGSPIMVVGPCIEKAEATGQPQSLIDGIRSDPATMNHPWAHSWTPTESLTLEAVRAAGLNDVSIVDIKTVKRPEWPNPSTASWQTAILATT